MEMNTRSCTRVLFADEPVRPDQLNLEEREVDQAWSPTQLVFRPDMQQSRREVIEIAEDLLRREQAARPQRAQPRVARARASRRDQVNSVRERVLREIQQSQYNSMRAVAKEAGCHVSTVRAVYKQLALRRRLQPYEYQPGHSAETQAELQAAIGDDRHKFWAITDYKRVVPQCSRQFIAKTLRGQGLRYVKARRERRDPVPRRVCTKQMKAVLWTSVQAFARAGTTLLFLDEAEFPLVNSSDRCWAQPDARPLYNRRPNQHGDALHLVALCSQEGMVAVQIYREHPNTQAVLHFLITVLKQVNQGQRTVVLLDNAGWHVAKLVTQSRIAGLLLYNVPRHWELNLIELVFAKAKDEWRRRSLAGGLGEEVEALARLLVGRDLRRDFQGYRREYLRRIIEFL